MSENDPRDPTQDPARTQRGPSVSLRAQSEGGAGVSERMDPANQSLADALKITYRLVQASMIVLVILFLASGFRTVGEGQRGIRLFAGAIRASNLSPGAHWAWPYPIGELVKIGTGAERVEINRAFFPWVEVGDEGRPIERLTQAGSLDPARDGSMITADLNLAHSQWTVTFRRVSLGEYAENVRPGDANRAEERLVRLVVQRAVVQAAAGVTIDDLLKQANSEGGSIESQAREIAQRMLDDLDTGIQIDQLTQSRLPFPPVTLNDKFTQVFAQAQSVGEAREGAAKERAQKLSEVAGAAAAPLIAQIELYEAATELGDAEAQAEILTRIDALLEGRRVEIDGEVYESLASGEIAETLTEASNQRAATVSRARADLAIFEAKVAQFNANPALMLTRDWAGAWDSFTEKGYVQTFDFAPGMPIDLYINADPTIIRDMIRDANRRDAERAYEQRMQDLRDAQYRTREGIRAPDDE